MKTERNEEMPNKKNLNLDEVFLNDDFIKYINALSESIKEYYIVTKNTNKNKIILLNIIEKKLNESESMSNIIFNANNEDYDKFQSYNEIYKNIFEFFKNLKENVISDEKNLSSFFEDAKLIFKKMKDYREEFIQNKIRTRGASWGLKSNINRDTSPNLYHKINIMSNQKQPSEIIHKLGKDFNSIEIQKDKIYPLTSRKVVNTKIDKTNLRTISQNSSSNYDDSNKMNITTDNKKFLNEIEKLKNINKKYEFNIRKLNLELKKYQSKLDKMEKTNSFKSIISKQNEDIDNNQIIQDELPINKDKIISSLKSEIEKNNKNYSDLLNNYKRLQKENSTLKIQNKPNNKIYNNLIKENYKLKNNIELLKTSNNGLQSDLNYKLNEKKYDLDDNNHNYIKEIDALKKNILKLEKKLSDEQMKNQELKNENNILRNKNEIEMSQLYKRNKELSLKLINNQNDLLNLQKEILGKAKEIDILKESANSKNNQENKMLIESIISIFEQENNNMKNSVNRPWNNLNESLNRILENYQKENQEIKTNFHEILSGAIEKCKE